MDDLVRGWGTAARVSRRNESWLRRHIKEIGGVKTAGGVWEFQRKDLERIRLPEVLTAPPRPPAVAKTEAVTTEAVNMLGVLKGFVRLAKEHPFATFAAGMVFGTAAFGQKGDVVKVLGVIEDGVRIRNRFAAALTGKSDPYAMSVPVDTAVVSASDDKETP